MFFYDAAKQHKIRKKDGNGSGGSDLIVDNLHFLKKSYTCMVPSNWVQSLR